MAQLSISEPILRYDSLMEALELSGLIDRQPPGFSLARPFYLSDDIFRAEWERIWRTDWLFAGTTAAIPKPGDYFTYTLREESVIVIRGDRGEVFAHHNSCRHRGSLVCLNEAGSAPKLMCPYHQWVYDKDGRLLRARLMPDDLDKSRYGLRPVQVRVVEGFVFVSLSDSPPDFAPLAAAFAPFLKPFRVDEAKVAFRKRYVLRTNWKLVAENFHECYHCGPAHPEYCNAVLGANLRESPEAEWNARKVEWEKRGLPTKTVRSLGDSFHSCIRYPLRPGVVSYSLDGKAVSRPMGGHADHDAGVIGLVAYPNLWLDAVSDYMWTMRLTPTGPSETVLDLAWLVDGAAEEGVDYELDRLVEFWRITGEQDWRLCENNFRGVESRSYEPGPYAPAEVDLVRFVEWYLGRMAAEIRAKAS
jgi:phenylpropionate dioxygenase-like ring-hydroxylating dioxygenase large terminal subunit